MTPTTVAQWLFDPRGRVDRKGLIYLALALLVMQALLAGLLYAAGLHLEHPVVMVLKLVFIWIALAAASKRLHDLGRSGLWIVGAAFGMIAWCVVVVGAVVAVYGLDGMKPGEAGHTIAFVVNMFPVLIATLWLHFAKGAEGENAYGPAPDHTGFSHPNDAAGVVAHA